MSSPPNPILPRPDQTKPNLEEMASDNRDDQGLPHELILDILLRLPAKPLGRCRCVSKLWCNLISDPEFIHTHLNKAIEEDSMNLFLASDPASTNKAMQTHIYCLEGGNNNTNPPFDESVQIENPLDFKVVDGSKVLGSCNGLICLGSMNVLCLLNPCTREYKVVKFEKKFNFSHKTVYGLGYDHCNDDYVLVQLVCMDGGNEFYDSDDGFEYDYDVNDGFDSQVNVYSLNDTTCLKFYNIPFRCWNGQEVGIYSYGYLYWLAKTELYSPLTIISYDIEEKMFRELPLPVNLGKGANLTLGVLRGQLCIFCDFYGNDIEVWLIENDGRSYSWLKLFSMEKLLLPRGPVSRVLCFCENGKVILKDGRKLILYDPITQENKRINHQGLCWEKICKRINHVASLVSVKSGTYVSAVSGVKPSIEIKRA